MSYINKKGDGYSWRRKVISNLSFDIINYEKVETSLVNARILKKIISKLIEFSKKNTLHSKRLALSYLNINSKNKNNVLSKLFVDLRERYKDRKGGYVRVNRIYHRRGDNSLRVLVSLV